MTHPGVYIATGVVIAVAAVIAFFTSKSANDNKEKPMRYGRRDSERRQRKSRSPTPSPSPPPSSFRNHRNYAECTNCGESSVITLYPCNHKSLCKGCVNGYLKNNDSCPRCNGRIDSYSPTIDPFGKCKDCKKFTELFKFLPCKHSLSLCYGCFESQKISYKKCPTCEQVIKKSDPMSSTSGICLVCNEFTPFAMFKPCGHGSFCKKHAMIYLKDSDNFCNECGKKVTMVYDNSHLQQPCLQFG